MKKDKELEEAILKGDFISVGPLGTEEKKIPRKKVKLDLKVSPTQYNGLIGIDFGKTLLPHYHLLSQSILQELVTIPKIPRKKRYLVQRMLNNLVLGNLIEYKNDMSEYLLLDEIIPPLAMYGSPIQEKKIEEEKGGFIDVLPLREIIKAILAVFLWYLDQKSLKFLSPIDKNSFVKYLENPQSRSKLKKKWRFKVGQTNIETFKIQNILKSFLSLFINIKSTLKSSESMSFGKKDLQNLESLISEIERFNSPNSALSLKETIEKKNLFSKVPSPIIAAYEEGEKEFVGENGELEEKISMENNKFVDFAMLALSFIFSSKKFRPNLF